MALLSGWKGGLVVGLVIGAGAGLALPVIAPGLGKAARPKVKAAMKAGLLAFERGRVALEELKEQAEDLMAEVTLETATENAVPSEAREVRPTPETRDAAAPEPEAPAGSRFSAAVPPTPAEPEERSAAA